MMIDSDNATRIVPPWIEKRADGWSMVIFGGSESNESVVSFSSRAEWEIIKARMDAAYAGRDPNLSSFYPPVTHVNQIVGQMP